MSPVWRRFAVTRLAFAQRRHLCDELAGRGITATCVAIGDDQNLETAEEFGFHTVEQNNEYLGRKFNDGFEYAVEQGADFVVSIGSDDWVHIDLFDRLPLDRAEMKEPTDDEPVVVWGDGPEIITGRQIVLVDLLNGRGKLCLSTGVTGVIPWIIPWKALERSGFRPIPDRLDRGIDGALIAGLKVQPEWVFRDPHELCRIDFKSEVNLNTYDRITAAIGGPAERLDVWDWLREKYPSELVELAYRTHLELA